MARLPGQVAIVTGGALGIGGATARRLAEEGAKVLIADVNAEAADRNAATIRAAGGVAETLRADVTVPADLERMVAHATRQWGRLDILVNNAVAPYEQGGAEQVSEAGWDAGMSLLVKSMFLAVKHAAPIMRAAGGGSIVNLASVHGLLQAPRRLVYEVGKTAVIGLTRQMAVEYGPDGIRVNAICPGHIVTERIQARWDANPSGFRFFERQYPLRRCGTPLDVANAIAFLCSAEAAFITGHALVVDGGLTVQFQEDLAVSLGRYIQEHPDTQFPF
jgi:NAD(P)-dependent dehydrogenase (short-subunit alcohol dehydrogenase family)